MIQKVTSTKSMLPDWAQGVGSGNFGYAEVAIDGVGKTVFYAYSRIHSVKPSTVDFDISYKPDSSPFTPMNVGSRNIVDAEDAWLRNVDSEFKILSDIQSHLGNAPKATGNIKLYTELSPCVSCEDVLRQFKEMYPGINVEVMYEVNY